LRGINAKAGEIRAISYVHDVTDYDSVPGLLQEATSTLAAWTCLSIIPASNSSGMKHFEFEKDRRMTDVNYLGALAWLNPVAAMFHRLKAGQIVGISSVAGEARSRG